jgi:hypothetical protein
MFRLPRAQGLILRGENEQIKNNPPKKAYHPRDAFA